MKRNISYILITLLILATVNQAAFGAVRLLTAKEANAIKGGFSCPLYLCQAGGTCPADPGCKLNEGNGDGECYPYDPTTFCDRTSYKQCALGHLATCNAGAGTGGCGLQYTRYCTYNQRTFTCIPSSIQEGNCSSDCQ